MPEHRLFDDLNWARGLGSTCSARATSGAEENVLCYDGDKYVGTCIAIHEFAHSFHERGMQALYPDLFQRV